MPLSNCELQAIAQLAESMAELLPGKPLSDPDLSFPGALRAAGLRMAWPNGSKRLALVMLLSHAYDRERPRFCEFVVQSVQRALRYRNIKNGLRRDEIERINALLLELGFMVPELCETTFLETLVGPPSMASA